MFDPRAAGYPRGWHTHPRGANGVPVPGGTKRYAEEAEMRHASRSRHIDMATVAMGVPAGVISNDTGFFFTGRWKHARIAAIVDVVAEVALLGMSISVQWHWATFWASCALIGASITAGACCCRANSGKCIANAQVSLTAISFIGSFVDIGILAHVTNLCNTYDYTGWSSKKLCDLVKALLALEVICLATRLTVITLACRLTCCRPAEWNVQSGAQPQVVVVNAAQAPTPMTASKV